MPINDAVQRLGSVLRDLAAIDFGYPLGENTVDPPNPAAANALAAAGLDKIKGLSELYSACDGISLPDIHNGYFVKPLCKVVEYNLNSEPDVVLMDTENPVLSFGSTGGGGLFVVERESGRVLLLPPGPLHDGPYDGRCTKVVVVAESIPHFLNRIIDDVAAFAKDDHGHNYLTAG